MLSGCDQRAIWASIAATGDILKWLHLPSNPRPLQRWEGPNLKGFQESSNLPDRMVQACHSCCLDRPEWQTRAIRTTTFRLRSWEAAEHLGASSLFRQHLFVPPLRCPSNGCLITASVSLSGSLNRKKHRFKYIDKAKQVLVMIFKYTCLDSSLLPPPI